MGRATLGFDGPLQSSLGRSERHWKILCPIVQQHKPDAGIAAVEEENTLSRGDKAGAVNAATTPRRKEHF